MPKLNGPDNCKINMPSTGTGDHTIWYCESSAQDRQRMISLRAYGGNYRAKGRDCFAGGRTEDPHPLPGTPLKQSRVEHLGLIRLRPEDASFVL